ncbi:hypothetical protein U2F26_30215 [Micromonospora sp. 4G57]|uniref:HNH endonuclease n=1 Tax=Micromonospora sicca TaxID=2202420 RepID=A0ABU5JM24_9ACTN|nr:MULTISPECIES: hypothetical protein [unclassified Micromonospora]MDZ5446949.1 hypothetical protein [Micromonospora sp. 4G57]MDZ5493626.1 hypothetical protein [Micromonospora sp. 4G53]
MDEQDWAGYVAGLDRGLDELNVEIGRAADRPETGPSVEDVLLTHTSALELTGWRMRFGILDARVAAVLSGNPGR